jgi:hypothetical protein
MTSSKGNVLNKLLRQLEQLIRYIFKNCHQQRDKKSEKLECVKNKLLHITH